MTDPDDRRFLDALRVDRRAAPPAGASARVARRLDGSPSLVESSRRPPARTDVRASRPVAAIAMAALVGAGIGAWLHAQLAPGPAVRVVYVERPDAPASGPPVASAPPPPEPSTSPPAIVHAPSAEERRAPSSGGLAQIDAERALLDAAHTAIVSEEDDTAIRALERHARTFARPILGEERDALFVQALAGAGRYDEARARAKAFRQRWPNSVFLPAVTAAIAAIP